MKRFFILFSVLTVALAAASCEKDIPVTGIEVDPSSATLFIGESIPVSVRYTPEDATNADEILIYSNNEKIISWDANSGIVTAKAGGTAALNAECGNIVSQCLVKVYANKFQKGKNTYGVDAATGYNYLMGTSTPQELEIILTHTSGSGTQNLKVWVTVAQLGKDLDYTKPLSDTFIGVYANNNEDGYLIYSSSTGDPMIVRADWSDAGGVKLVRGNLRVEHLQFTQYSIKADFELANGYRFGTDFSGNVSMKTE